MGRIFILFGITSILVITSAVASELIALPGADISGLWQYLEQNSAELNAARLENSAAEQRAEATGVLPDPSVRIEWQDINQANRVTLNPSQVAAVKYSVLQPIPGWGKRDVQRQTAVANANWAKAQQQTVIADLRAQVRLNFAQYYRIFHATQLNDELKNFATSASKLAQSRYERGQSGQQEWVKAQLDEAVLKSDGYALQAEYRKAQARLNALLNRASDAPLAAPQLLPDLPYANVMDETQLQTRLRASAPQISRQTALSASARGEVEMARKNQIPDFIVAIAPVQRGNGVSSWDAMLEFTIPLQQGSHGAHRHEADERLSASQAREQALGQNLSAELSEHKAALAASTEQLQLIRQQSLPLIEMAFKSALAAYQNGRLDYATLWQVRKEVQRNRLDELDALTNQQIHLAEIERLLGEAL
jgi:outer membrane protein TolC